MKFLCVDDKQKNPLPTINKLKIMTQKNMNGNRTISVFRGELFNKVDPIVTKWMFRKGNLLIRVSIGVVFVWFGVLKFFPGLSPAQELAIRTIRELSFGILPDYVIINLLAFWEVTIGLGLIFGKFIREILLLLFLQMSGTFSPIFLFPGEMFTHFPYAPTLEGQYIIKNLVLITGGIVVGGKLHSDIMDEKIKDLEENK